MIRIARQMHSLRRSRQKRTATYIPSSAKAVDDSGVIHWRGSVVDSMTGRYTAWNVLAILLDDVVLIIKALHAVRVTQQGSGVRAALKRSCIATLRASRTVRPLSLRTPSTKSASPEPSPPANDNWNCASTLDVMPVIVTCRLVSVDDRVNASGRLNRRGSLEPSSQ